MSDTCISAHNDSVLCCEVQPTGKLLASGGEVNLNFDNDLFISLLLKTPSPQPFPIFLASPSQDGNLCLTDLTSLRTIARLPLNQANDVVIPSLAFHPTDAHSLFAAAGNSILHLDLRKSLSITTSNTNTNTPSSSSLILHQHTINQDEINCIKINHKATWLAAADDSGEITLLDLSSSLSSSSLSSSSSPSHISKILRRGHSNICSTVAFRSHRPWEVMSGGLDAILVRWDFSRLKTVKKWNIATETATASQQQQQFINPPMVHCITTPYGDEVEDRTIAKLVVIARGDGCVAVYDGDDTGSGSSGGNSCSGEQRGIQRTKKKGGGRGKSKGGEEKGGKVDGGPLSVLRSDNGGHTSSANCVEFVHGCGWKRVVSGGNDGRCVVWKWERETSCNEETERKENRGVEVNKGMKVNCVCSTDNIGGYNLFIGDVDGNITAKTV